MTDTGCGAADENRLFVAFCHVGSSASRTHFSGSGIGLHVARQLARHLGGDCHYSRCISAVRSAVGIVATCVYVHILREDLADVCILQPHVHGMEGSTAELSC